VTKRFLLAFAAIGATGITVSVWKPLIHRNSSDVGSVLKGVGYKPDASGRFQFENQSLGGLTLAYDPNLKNPTTGFRACIGRTTACQIATKNLDDCMSGAPKCVSATPWKNDPNGEDCCPESCIREYFSNRKTQTPGVALSNVVDGMCYPGLQSYLNRSEGGAP